MPRWRTKWRPCKGTAISQAFIFHIKYYSILHFAVCQLLGWALLFPFMTIQHKIFNAMILVLCFCWWHGRGPSLNHVNAYFLFCCISSNSLNISADRPSRYELWTLVRNQSTTAMMKKIIMLLKLFKQKTFNSFILLVYLLSNQIVQCHPAPSSVYMKMLTASPYHLMLSSATGEVTAHN